MPRNDPVVRSGELPVSPGPDPGDSTLNDLAEAQSTHATGQKERPQ
jgi:hypothetical protein